MKAHVIGVSLAVVLSMTSILMVGCETQGQTGALIGTGIGAGVGALASGRPEGALIGGAVGGGAGYIVGNEADKKQQQQQMNSMRAEIDTVTVNITNSNGSISTVRLRKQGPGYIGPRGEYYTEMPTSEQLRPVYGF